MSPPSPPPPPPRPYTISKSFCFASLVRVVYFWHIQHNRTLGYFEWLSGGWNNEHYFSYNSTLDLE